MPLIASSPTPIEVAVEVLGGQAAMARALQITRGQVHHWMPADDGKPGAPVPIKHCPTIERLTRAAGRPVLCEHLRSDVDWAVLRENPQQRAPRARRAQAQAA